MIKLLSMLGLFALAVLPPVHAASVEPLRAAPAVDASVLATMRGGFDANGLHIAFGVERAVYVNGELVTSTRLDVASNGVISTSTAAGSGALVQRGTRNAFDAVTTSGAAAIVQNSLDGQTILGVTRIDATVTSLDAARRSALSTSILDGTTGSLRR